MRTRTIAILAAQLTLVTLLTAPPASAATSTVNSLFDDLQVVAESPTGYDRARFRHWVDVDGDLCNTRAEVLKAESMISVSVTPPCKITAGKWVSWFEGVTQTDPGDLDIDHLVPLAEAWRSGANQWTDEQREAYANDLELDASLVAVTSSINRSKGDRDPADWLPPQAGIACRYVSDWVAVKYRWRLTVDPAEHAAIERVLAGGCGATKIAAPARGVPAMGSTPTAQQVKFTDVPAAHPFYKEIVWMGAEGISTGWATARGHEYRPSQKISREAMAAFTYRLAGSPRFTPPTKSPFRDVKTTDAFYREITWLASQKITTGYPDGTFRPRNKITREAMAAFMYRYENRPSVATPTRPVFTDVSPGHAFYREITWMATTGVTTGYTAPGGCYIYKPRSNVSREAMAAFMYRLEVGGTKGISQGCVPKSPSYQSGVRAGAFCKPAGAYGLTTKGTVMKCTTTNSDSRNRWREA